MLRLILALLIVFGGGLSYTLWHVWNVLPFSALWRSVVVVLFAAMVLMMFFVVLPIIDHLPLTLGTVVYEIGGSGLIILLYTFLSFLLLDIARLLHIIPRSVLHSNGYTALVLTLLLLVVFIAGNIHYHHKQRHTLDLTTTKPLDRELRIVAVSDLHLGYHNHRQTLEKWVTLLNSEHPDLIIMAGDLVDRSIRPLRDDDMASLLRQLSSPVYACFGNHEYFCGVDKMEQFYRDAGITLLRDSAATIDGITIIGRDDRMNAHRQSLAALTARADTSSFTIVLDHQPWHLEEAEQAGIDFQFSGHTHDGQVVPLSFIVEAVYENAYGPSSRGATNYYVSSGLGIWGGKFRIGTCSEYVVVTIRPEAQ